MRGRPSGSERDRLLVVVWYLRVANSTWSRIKQSGRGQRDFGRRDPGDDAQARPCYHLRISGGGWGKASRAGGKVESSLVTKVVTSGHEDGVWPRNNHRSGMASRVRSGYGHVVMHGDLTRRYRLSRCNADLTGANDRDSAASAKAIIAAYYVISFW